MDIILLAKFVPDVEKIPADAWDRERGTLIRIKLKMTFNPLDRVALNAAKKIKAAQPETKIVALTMGPQSAKFMLRESLAHGADEAVHLEDRRFAGADTIATAYTIARAISSLLERGVVKKDFTVFAGMQSSDGDTAQVPAQVASLLGAPLYPYFSNVEADAKKISLTCLNTIGTQTVTPRRKPFVATATKLFDGLPFYTSVEDIIRANDKEITSLNADDISADAGRIGLHGSRTRVVKIFEPPQRHKAAEPVDAFKNGFQEKAAELLACLKKSFASINTDYHKNESAPATSTEQKFLMGGAGGNFLQKVSSTPSQPSTFYSGSCVVLCENNESGLAPVSLEIASACSQFARQLGVKSIAVVPGERNDDAANLLREHGINEVLFIKPLGRRGLLVKESAEVLVRALRELLPQIAIAPATLSGRVIAPYISAALDCGLTADCSALEVGGHDLGGATYHGILRQTRPALGGNIMATIVSIYEGSGSKPQMATVRPGALKPLKFYAEDFSVKVVDTELPECPDMIDVTARQKDSGHDDITQYKVVICAGKGAGEREAIGRFIEPFRLALEKYLGTPVGLGCSRSVVDSGILPHSHQIGQTGSVVKPSIYIGIGVSGAVQHRIGMANADMVISVNADRDCAMSRLADHSIIGDAEKVLPVLTDILKKISV